MVDGGDFAWKTARLTADRLPQQRRKAELQLKAFTDLGIDGMVPGQADLALGVDWLKAAAAAVDAPLLAANLTCGGSAPFPATRRVTRDGITLGIVGVMSKKDAAPSGCSIDPPIAAVKAGIAALDDHTCEVAFGVPVVAAPYVAVCRVALRRIGMLVAETKEVTP